jgi:nucleotide-binding universal stress UspA family protein
MINYSVHKILVPVDLSETSLNALDTAVIIAQKHQAQLYILHIRDNAFQFYDSDDSFYALTAAAETSVDILQALTGAIQHKYDIKPKLLIKEGFVSPIIVRESIKNNCDLIVLGTHGASGYRDGFLGSNTYHVIKYSGCPVLSVPPFIKPALPGFRKALFPIRPVSGALHRYDIACHFINRSATLDVLGLSYRSTDHDIKILESIVDEIRGQLDTNRVYPRANWSKGAGIAEDVLLFSMEEKNDLIIISSALDVTNKQQFIGPHTQKILNTAKVPILTIKKLGIPALA